MIQLTFMPTGNVTECGVGMRARPTDGRSQPYARERCPAPCARLGAPPVAGQARAKRARACDCVTRPPATDPPLSLDQAPRPR